MPAVVVVQWRSTWTTEEREECFPVGYILQLDVLSEDKFSNYLRLAYFIFDGPHEEFFLFWGRTYSCLTSLIDLGLVCETSQLSRNFLKLLKCSYCDLPDVSKE